MDISQTQSCKSTTMMLKRRQPASERHEEKGRVRISTESIPNLTTNPPPVSTWPHVDSPRLNQRQIEVLKNIRQLWDYKVKILNGSIDNKPRMVVLLGEVHIKGSESAALGDALLKEFPLRGMEGIRMTWLTKAILAVPRKILALLLNLHQSTIIQANKIKAETGETVNINLEEDTNNYIGGFLVSRRIFDLLYSQRLLFLPENEGLQSISRVMEYVDLYRFFIDCADICYYSIDLGTSLLDTFDSLDTLDENSILAKLKKYILPEQYYFRDHRDFAMCKKIMTTFSKDSDKETMLVITGLNHTNHLARILRKKFDFEEQDLDSI